jgi:hypothetical protein
MESLEADIQMAPQEEAEFEDSSVEREDREEIQVEDRDDDDEDDRHPLDRGDLQAEGNDGTIELYSEAENDGEDDEDIKTGETVTAGEYHQWERIEGITEDRRKEPHFDTTFKTNLFREDDAMEVDIFRAFMPLDMQQLLETMQTKTGTKEFGWHSISTQQ